VDTYRVGDELEGKVTKVVTFGAFVEIMEGVEGLVHISELAQHHVENPREVVEPGDDVKVKILEIDSDRRRLSLSVKRVEAAQAGQVPAGAGGEAGGGEDRGEIGEVRDLGLSEDVFAGAEVNIEGSENLRAAVEEAQEQEAPPAEEEEAEPPPPPPEEEEQQ